MAIQPTLISNNAEAGPSTPQLGRVPTYKLAQSLDGHRRSITALRWTHDGQGLISAGADGLLNVWTAIPPFSSLSHSHTIRAHSKGINDLSISPDDLYVATASDDKSIHIFPVSPLVLSSTAPPPISAYAGLSPPIRVLEGHTAPVLALAFSPKSNLLVSGSFDESAIVWDVRRGIALRHLPAHSEAVWTVGWDGEGMMVLTGSADGLIRLWDASTAQCLKTLDNDSNSPVTSAFFTPNPFHLISGTAGAVRVYNIHTGKVVKTLRPNAAPDHNATAKGNTAEAKDANGAGAVVVSMTAALPSYVQKGEDSMEVDTVEGQVTGRTEAWVLATTGETGPAGSKVVIWELGSRRVVQTLEGHKTQVIALAVHPGGRLIATGSLEPEKLINVWRDDE